MSLLPKSINYSYFNIKSIIGMIKKTSIDRNSVYGLFESIDPDFARTLLAQSFPELETVPSLEDIETILTKVGN
jgi:predicted transcriptional regulator